MGGRGVRGKVEIEVGAQLEGGIFRWMHQSVLGRRQHKFLQLGVDSVSD